MWPGEVAAARAPTPTPLPHGPPPGGDLRLPPLAPFRPRPARRPPLVPLTSPPTPPHPTPHPFQVWALSSSAPVIGFAVPGARKGLRKKRGLGGGVGEQGASAGRGAGRAVAWASPVARAARRAGGWTLISGRGGAGEGVHPSSLRDSYTWEMELIDGALYPPES